MRSCGPRVPGLGGRQEVTGMFGTKFRAHAAQNQWQCSRGPPGLRWGGVCRVPGLQGLGAAYHLACGVRDWARTKGPPSGLDSGLACEPGGFWYCCTYWIEWLRARGATFCAGMWSCCVSSQGPGVMGPQPVCLGLWSRTDGRLESRRRSLEVLLVILIEESWRLHSYNILGFCCALVPVLTCYCWRVWQPFDFLASLDTELLRSGVLRIPFWWSFAVWNLSGRPVASSVCSSMGRHRRTEASHGNTMEHYTTRVALPQRTARSEVSGDVADVPLSVGEPLRAELLAAIQGSQVALEGKIESVDK
ncbi:hypothetical protein NDU88_003403 [Pleurodeles waltl]|uniref:Uncharacterized protein n=1 Tax=Pleurodeles waltl TaxID=8319 RepID=A0AAV7NJ92_PLEWA|nr:hypothetical protein NDU88_003403 [Pleurodeles waltl]